jgi:hypothetical protein
MSGRFRTGVIVAAIVAAFVAAAAGVYYWKYGRAVNLESLAASLPGKDGAVVYLDIRALRTAGVLDSVGGGSGVAEEADYKAFVAVTHFNYREDLDAVLASYHTGGMYALAAGRFDWASLRNYALTQSGKCADDLCTMPSSQPGRTISFFPFRPGVLALAVSRDSNAHAAFRQSRQPFVGTISKEPLWISFPGALLKGDDKLPAGTRLFSKILESAQRVNFAFGLKGVGFELSMDAACATPSDAEAAVNQLNGVTDVMLKYFSRMNQTPNPKDMSGVLTSGIYSQDGARVHGVWPIERGFLENLTGGGK